MLYFPTNIIKYLDIGKYLPFFTKIIGYLPKYFVFS